MKPRPQPKVRHSSSYKQQNRTVPMESMYAATASILTIVILVAIIVTSTYMAGETPAYVGGIGVLAFFTSIGCFVYNLRKFKEKTDLRIKLSCLIVSSVAALAWLAIYVLGMLR